MNFGLRHVLRMGLAILLASLTGMVGCAGNGGVSDDDDATTPVIEDDDVGGDDDDATDPVVTPTEAPCTDLDGDGYCFPADCNDDNPSINPGAEEICELPDAPVDNNCDNIEACYVDNDGDLWTEIDGDCDDDNDGIGPHMTEVCDGVIDENCDGREGEGCTYVDDDGDGQSEDEGDCDDADDQLYDGADERFDGKDNDCDGEPEQEVNLDLARDPSVIGGIAGENLGWSVAGIRATPDGLTNTLNGDTLADVAIGAPGYGGNARGGVRLYFGSYDFGSYDAPSQDPNLWGAILSETLSTAKAGRAVAAIGDIDYDGFMDLAVGAPFFDTTLGTSTFTDAGYVYIVGGKDGTWADMDLQQASNATATVPGLQAQDQVGSALSGGNVNGDLDGVDDLLFGAPNPNTGGYMMIVPGTSTFGGTVLANGLSFFNPSDGMEDMELGHSIAYVGDTDGDSIGDFVVGGRYSAAHEGAVIWVPGDGRFDEGTSYSNFEDIEAVLLVGSIEGENVGWKVAGNGDIDADGSPDFVVTEEANTDLTNPIGYIFFGGDRFMGGGSLTSDPQSIEEKANIRIMASSTNVCPCSVAIDGDMNGDGVNDILFGASGASTVYLILGKQDLPLNLYLELNSDYVFRGVSGDGTGYSVAWVGSLNGDAFDDFVIGAPFVEADVSVPDTGAAYFMMGFDPAAAQ